MTEPSRDELMAWADEAQAFIDTGNVMMTETRKARATVAALRLAALPQAREAADKLAWQRRGKDRYGKWQDWVECSGDPQDQQRWRNNGCEIRSLYASPPPRAGRETLDDLVSHRDAWRVAIVRTMGNSPPATVHNDDKLYWHHELRAFDRVFAALSSVKPQDAKDDVRERVIEECITVAESCRWSEETKKCTNGARTYGNEEAVTKIVGLLRALSSVKPQDAKS